MVVAVKGREWRTFSVGGDSLEPQVLEGLKIDKVVFIAVRQASVNYCSWAHERAGILAYRGYTGRG